MIEGYVHISSETLSELLHCIDYIIHVFLQNGAQILDYQFMGILCVQTQL